MSTKKALKTGNTKTLNKQTKMPLFVVIGPTASGKSEFAVKLAKKIGGEIISADSRQVYQGLDIGSGKVEGKWNKGVYTYKGVTHFLIDVASPRRQFSVVKFQSQARAAIAEIYARGHIPIICGGTAQWVDAVVFGHNLPSVKPNAELRAKLEKLTTAQMFAKLRKLDPARARGIDANNPRRLVRALEIVMTTGKPVPKLQTDASAIYKSEFDVTWIGLNPDLNNEGMPFLEKKINKRLQERLNPKLKVNIISEVKNLRKELSWKRLESFGLEYKFGALFLQNKITREELDEQLFRAIRQYAKRQLTWWKRNKNIRWYADASKVSI